MAYTFPSPLFRQILHPGVRGSQARLGSLSSYSGTLSSPLKSSNQILKQSSRNFSSPALRTVQHGHPKSGRGLSYLWQGAAIAGVGLGLANQRGSILRCEALPTPAQQQHPIYPDEKGPPPNSSVSAYELGFGTVAGLCAGVFVKKGAKAVAWFLGGIFVLLQYLSSGSLVRVDWGRMATKFEGAFHRKDPKTGASKPPNVLSLWNWLIDFLTADFQPRASFIAGFALGLRIG